MSFSEGECNKAMQNILFYAQFPKCFGGKKLQKATIAYFALETAILQRE